MGSNGRVNISSLEILQLVDRNIANSKAVHDRVASVPLKKLLTNSHGLWEQKFMIQ